VVLVFFRGWESVSRVQSAIGVSGKEALALTQVLAMDTDDV